MQVTFLSADVPLVKTYSKVHGSLVKAPYPHVSYFTSIMQDVASIQDLHTTIKYHAKQGHCLLKGNVQRPLFHESRAGSTVPDHASEWVCLDIDGLKGYDDPLEVMRMLRLDDIDYIVQYSASHGIEEQRGLSCHVFFLLTAPVRAPLLKTWLMHLNLTTPALREAISLTRAGAALRWPLDITVCQNDKLLFIAPPTLNAVSCSLAEKDRIKLVKNTLRALPTDRIITARLEQTKSMADALRDELRAQSGYAKLRKGSLKWERGLEIQHNPGQAIVTETKQERGFMYLNLNGGDSWGYYHPETDASLIFNFKGEPAYKTEELLPEYWAAWQERLATEADPLNTGVEHFAVCDDRSGAYYVGHYDYGQDTLHLSQAKNETQVKSYLKEHNLPIGEFIARWTVGFDPHSLERFDKQNKTINTYTPSPLLRELSTQKKFKRPPPEAASWPTIYNTIFSAIGSDDTLVEPFLNWLACVVQHRTKIGVAWVLHGVQGSGKGLLVNHIMRPIVGMQHVGSQLMSRFGGRFNANLEDKLLMLVDEARIGASKNANELSETIKHLITENPIDIERKFANTVAMENYTNFIFASNQPDPVHVDTHDRRFNVATYQPKRYLPTPEAVDKLIPAELPAFAEYLWRRTASMAEARRILNTAARQGIIDLSRDSGTMIADALLAGDLEIFIDSLRDIPQGLDHSPQHIAYEAWLLGIVRQITAGDLETRLSRDDIGMIYQYCIGETVPSTPTKLTQYLHHKGLKVKNHVIRGKVQRGIVVDWKLSPEILERCTALIGSQKIAPIRRVA